jgi:hypothetical protein
MDNKIKIQCTRCRMPFRERVSQVKEGHQTQCPNCNRLITFSGDSADVAVRRAMTEARRIIFGIPALTPDVQARS